MKERFEYIDIAKGIAIILVVYGHGIAQMKGSILYEQSLLLQSQVIFSFVMPLFFMISAALQRSSLERTNLPVSEYVIKYGKAIFLPFFALSVLFLLLNLILIPNSSPSFVDMVTAILVMQSSPEMLPSGILWFLYTLFVFVVFTAVLSKGCKAPTLLILFIAIGLKVISVQLQGNYLFGIDKVTGFYIYFAIGYSFKDEIIRSSGGNIVKFLAFLGGFISLFLYQKIYPDSLGTEIFGVLGLVGCVATFVMMDVGRFASKFDNWIIVCIRYMGQYSILVYVFHMPTFTVMKKISSIIGVVPGSYSALMFLFLPGVLLPLLYGKLISSNRLAYKILLGRTP